MLTRLSSVRRAMRRRVLAHRRLLAFVLTAVAVVVGLSVVRPATPPTVAMTVASADLPAGTILTASDVRQVDVSPDHVPSGITGEVVGETLAAPVRQGEPVTDVRLIGPSVTANQPDVAAVPVRFADADMAALLTSGDEIDLYATDPASAETSLVTEARVLGLPGSVEDAASGVPQKSDPSGVMPAGSGRLVLVGVPHGAVPTVTAAGVGGFLSFAYSS